MQDAARQGKGRSSGRRRELRPGATPGSRSGAGLRSTTQISPAWITSTGGSRIPSGRVERPRRTRDWVQRRFKYSRQGSRERHYILYLSGYCSQGAQTTITRTTRHRYWKEFLRSGAASADGATRHLQHRLTLPVRPRKGLRLDLT